MAHATAAHRNDFAAGLIWIGRQFARVPVSIFLLTIVTILAIVNGSLVHSTDPAIIQRWGISWDNLARGRVLNIPISDLLVLEQAHYLSTLFLVVFFTGVAEWLGGPLLAALTFWPPSWLGTLIAMVITKFLMQVTSWAPNPDLVHTADVGSSVGNWGSAGALIVLIYGIKPLLGKLLGAGFFVFLVGRLAMHRSTSDVAHVFGLMLGFLICRAYLAWRLNERSSAT